MKAGFRQSMSWLHTWSSLLLGWLLFFIFLTGTAGYFDTEIDRWMQPELPPSQQVPAGQALPVAVERLQERAGEADRWFISLPSDRNIPYLRIFWQQKGKGTQIEQLDLATGQPLEARDTGGGQLLYRMHWQLHYLPALASTLLVGVATMMMLVAIVTGVVVHKKIFVDFFTFRPRKGQRSWLDAHNVLAVTALPFHLMITYSGLIFLVVTLMPLLISAHYGGSGQGRSAFYAELLGQDSLPERAGVRVPLASFAPMLEQAEARWGQGGVAGLDVRHPGDAAARVIVRQNIATGPLRSGETMTFDGTTGALLGMRPAAGSASEGTHALLLGLHEGLFARPLLRWLYFIAGLMGTAMVATGLVLWTTKRRQKLEQKAQAPHRGLLLVERLNVGTIVGLPVGIAAYFWANRLIPAGLAGRADWEVHAMFVAWAAMLLHAALRPRARAWAEQCWIASAAYALLPVLNALTTDRHLGRSLFQGDWVMAGFDLSMLGFGAAFALAARMMARKAKAAPAPRRAARPALDPAGARAE